MCDEENINYSYGRFTFDELTKNNLTKKLENAFKKTSFKGNVSEQAELLVLYLEGFIEGTLELKEIKPPVEKQERRRERLLSIAAHLEGVVDQFNSLDSAASEYSIFMGLHELEKINDPSHETPDVYSLNDMLVVESLKSELLPIISKFAYAIRMAEKTLPFHRYNKSDSDASMWASSDELQAALFVEDLFYKSGLKYTMSNSGCAASCLRAIYSHINFNCDRVDYWLKKAKSHKDSFSSFIERQKQQDK